MTGPGGRVEVVAGGGTVVRHGGIVAWAGPGASGELLRWLERSAANLAPSPRGGRLLAEHLRGLLAARDPEPGVAWVAAGPDGAGGRAVVLHGDVQLWDGGGWRRGPGPGRVEVVALGPVGVVLVGQLGTTPPAASSHPLLDLVDGVVPGGGFALLERPGPAPATQGRATPQAAHDLQAPAGGPVASPAVDRTEVAPVPRPAGVIGLDPPPGGPSTVPVAAGPPAPVVGGARCPSGHLNPPGTAACARCRRVIPEPQRLVSGPRPPLGVLVADDGSLWRLDRSYLVGADPTGDPAVTGGTARALALRGDRVARVQAEVRLGDWAPIVVDRGTAAPTHVLEPGQDTWRPLQPWRAEPLRPGTHVAVGDRVLTWISPWPG